MSDTSRSVRPLNADGGTQAPTGTAYTPIEWEPLSAPAKRLGCSTRHLQREVEAGRLKAVPIDSRRVRTCPAWVDEWMLARVAKGHTGGAHE